ncbi:MAG: hypothetical protein KIT09_13185 [Bryobacteraceae bacterium]|nr:hypothetical protein [Bryobacteraceae bacterium]
MTVTSQEKYEALAGFYLSLWKRLDQLSAEAKWTELRPIDPQELKDHIEDRLQTVMGYLDDQDLRRLVDQDHARTEELVRRLGDGEANEMEGFKVYLRDQGLRYEEAADDAGEELSASHCAD